MRQIKLLYLGLLLILILPQTLFSQAPDGVNYQAVVRNSFGLPLNNEPVNVRFTIHQGSPTGTSVFLEIHPSATTSTNQFGLINIELGSVNNAAFSAINWGTGGAYYLQIEVEVVSAGLGYVDLGASQLLSVPYALFAKSAATGAQGFNSLIDTVTATIAACPTGGYQVLTGLDANANTVLDPGEVSSSFVVCNGSTGAANLNDTSATNELQTLSISNDTIFLSNGGFVVLPSITGDNDWVQGAGVVYNNTDFVGIGIATPPHQLTVVSTDTVVASFTSTNPNVAVISVVAINPNAAAGIVLLSGVDSGMIAVDPPNKTLWLSHSTPGGHTGIYADSAVALYGDIIGNISRSTIINAADTIFNVPITSNIINVNLGTFYTDSLYVLGNNFSNPNWVLANNGLGGAVWTDPTTLPGGGGGWGLLGNAGTAATDAIGTTDAQGFRIITNNIERIKVTQTGNVGIGISTPNPLAKLHIAEAGQAVVAIQASHNGAGDQSGMVTMLRSRGTITAPTNVLGGDRLGKMEFNGWDGGTWKESASIRAEADENFTPIGQGSHLGFYTTAIGTNFSNESMRINGNGFIGIGTTIPTQRVQIENGSLRIENGGSGYTFPLGDGGANDVLTTDGAGNASWQPGGGGNLWNLNGSDINYMAGKVGIGVLAPSSSLHLWYSGTDVEGQIIDFNSTAAVGTNTGLYVGANKTGGGTIVGGTFITTGSAGATESVSVEAQNSAASQTNFGVRSTVSGAGTTNFGIYSEVNGAVTNWAAFFASGDVYIQDNLVIPTGAASGSVLTSDAAGVASWQPLPPAVNFSVNTSSTFIPDVTITGLIFANVEYDNGGNFNVATGQFMAPETGVYHIDASVLFDTPVNGEIELHVLRNGGTYKRIIVNTNFNVTTSTHISVDVFLPINNTVSIGVFQTTGGVMNPTLITPINTVYFTGHLVR